MIRQHCRYQLFTRIRDGVHLAAAKRQPFAGSKNGCASDQTFAARGRNQPDLELDGEDLRAVRRKGHSSISGSAVGNAADHYGMGVPVLLCEIGREWHANVNSARLDKLKRRSQRLHTSLPCEAASNFLRSSQDASAVCRKTLQEVNRDFGALPLP
jgi:hypothetical protein